MSISLPRTCAKLNAGEQVTIVCLGDSNTAMTFHTQGRLNYVGLIEAGIFERYGDNKARVINAGACGDRVLRALDRLDRDVLRFNPDLVIVGFGMNDANTEAPIETTFLQPMRQLVARLRQAGTEVLLRTPNPVVGVNALQPAFPAGLPAGYQPGRPIPDDVRRVYSQALVRLAGELRCPVVDHYQLWIQHPQLPYLGVNDPNSLWVRMSDPVHPNGRGHLAFYRELAPFLNLPVQLSWER